jgi:two-component system nitrogen regulation response regulator GlnG
MATVLVADDDALVRRVISEALSTAGHTVLAADTAHRALTVDEEYDVALIDVHLDNRRRSDLGDVLRRRAPTLPIIVMSGLPDDEGYSFANAVLAKPFSFDELLETIARLVNGR